MLLQTFSPVVSSMSEPWRRLPALSLKQIHRGPSILGKVHVVAVLKRGTQAFALGLLVIDD